MRVPFIQLFSIANGMVTARQTVRLGDTTLTPGMTMGMGAMIGGQSMGMMVGKDLEVENENGVYVIKSTY